MARLQTSSTEPTKWSAEMFVDTGAEQITVLQTDKETVLWTDRLPPISSGKQSISFLFSCKLF